MCRTRWTELAVFLLHFFNLLWYENKEVEYGKVLDMYRFWKVQNLDSGVQGGFFNQDNFFVPINISNSHWLFLQVDFKP